MGFSFFTGHQGVKEQGKRQQKKIDGDTPEVLTLRMGFGGWGIDKVSWDFAQAGVEGTTSDCEFSRGLQYIIYGFDFVLYFVYCRCFACFAWTRVDGWVWFSNGKRGLSLPWRR